MTDIIAEGLFLSGVAEVDGEISAEGNEVKQGTAVFTQNGLATLVGTAAETVLETFTIPANRLKLNDLFKVFSSVSYDNLFFAAINYTLRVRVGGLGGVIVFDSGAKNVPSMTTIQTRLKAEFLVESIGAGGTLRPSNGLLMMDDGTFKLDNASANAVALDTTVSQDVVLTVQMGSASGAIRTCNTATVMELNHDQS